MKNYVLITGASSGIGAALAETYAAKGSNLILVARREERLREVALRCKAIDNSIAIEILVGDVGREDFSISLSKFLEKIENLTLVFANAGVGATGRFDKLALHDFKRQLDVNVLGVVQTIQGSLPKMQKTHGRYVIIGSINSYLALPLGAPYNIGKFAVRGLAESLYCEAPLLGVEFSLVCPGPIETEILFLNNKGAAVAPDPALKLKNALTPKVAAARICKQVARDKREIFISYDSRAIVWLYRHLPCLSLFLTRAVFSKFREKFLDLIRKINPDVV